MSEKDYMVCIFLGMFLGAAIAIAAMATYWKACNAASDSELIKRGYKAYHPTTGKLVWKDEVTE